MTVETVRRGRLIGTWVLRVLLGLFFFVIGGSKLTGTLHTVEFFAAIGWGQWFRYLTGVLDVLAAVLLFTRWTFYGAAILCCSVGSATVICFFLLHDNWATPLTFLLLALLLAWLTRPRFRSQR